jgi:ketosteroid isomerase-like protein
MGTVEENKTYALRIFECFNSGDTSYLENELLAPDFTLYSPTLLEPGGTREVVDFVHSLHHGFPDFQVEIEDVIAEDDKVAVRFRSTSQTHLGPYRAVPPTGRNVTMRGVHLFRFRGENLVDTWMEIDALGGVQQMGVVAPTGIGTLARIRFTLASLVRMAALEARHSIREGRAAKAKQP